MLVVLGLEGFVGSGAGCLEEIAGTCKGVIWNIK